MARIFVDLLSLTGTKGGMEVYARELYRQLGEIGTQHEYVGWFSTEGYGRDRSWFPGECINSGISGENRIAWARGEVTVGSAAKKHGADLIHSPATLGPAYSAMPTVVTMHDVIYWSHPEQIANPVYTLPVKVIEKLVARNATRIITISDFSRDELIRFLNIDPAKISVIYLAGEARQGIDRSRAGERGPLVLATGQRLPHKNWDRLIRSIALIPEAQRPRLAITGSFGDDPLRQVVTDAGLENWVDLYGWVSEEELNDLYSVATALAMPSLVEGFAMPNVEALNSGLPLVASDTQVHREVIGDDAAVFFDPFSEQAIADAITSVTSDAALRDKLVTAGFQQGKLYSWRKNAEETLELFNEVLAQNAATTNR